MSALALTDAGIAALIDALEVQAEIDAMKAYDRWAITVDRGTHAESEYWSRAEQLKEIASRLRG